MTQELHTPSANEEARVIHWTLLGGVTASGLLLATGLWISIQTHQHAPEGEPPSLSVLFGNALNGRSVAITSVGLLLLMATPILRVLVLSLLWLGEGDWRFAGISATVLGLLILSAVLGAG